MKERSGGENERGRKNDEARAPGGGTPDRERLSGDGQGDWRDDFGAYGFNAQPRRRDAFRSGYGEQGFGAGESRGGNWAGGGRGGYGGGQPGGTHGMRGGWSAAGERFEQGRGPRSYGPDGWGGGPEYRSRGWRDASNPRAPVRRSPRREGGPPDSYADAPWTQSEFAGRGEFGSPDPGDWNQNGYPARRVRPSAQRPTHDWTIPGPHSGRGPEGYQRSESAIRDDVCERLTRHGHLDATRITVRVDNGEVILEGTVDSRSSKRMAEETAETVSGVRDVHNRLRIEGSSHDRQRMEGRSAS